MGLNNKAAADAAALEEENYPEPQMPAVFSSGMRIA
jgi:hypothetical protein